MNLKSMKKTPSQKKEDQPSTIAGPVDAYPYGLVLDIRDDQVELLNISACKVGDEVTVFAKAKVIRRSESESENTQGSNKSLNVDLQITDMEIVKENPDRADQLYKT